MSQLRAGREKSLRCVQHEHVPHDIMQMNTCLARESTCTSAVAAWCLDTISPQSSRQHLRFNTPLLEDEAV
jgi:hypothetical protein